MLVTEPIRSVPALAVALRRTDRRGLPTSTAVHLLSTELVPLYQVEGGDEENEIQSATHTISMVTDKLRRMANAYGEWHQFDAPAFFDLYPKQVKTLMHVSERVTTVHVAFYADLLLPSFQRAEQYWSEEFFPAYQAAHPFSVRADRQSSYTKHFFEITQPKMVAYWARLLAVVRGAREQLSEDIGFLASAGGSEERAFWRKRAPRYSAKGLDDALLVPLSRLPTLTLSIAFPLPTHRQPGRLRRLRRMWQRGDWRRR